MYLIGQMVEVEGKAVIYLGVRKYNILILTRESKTIKMKKIEDTKPIEKNGNILAAPPEGWRTKAFNTNNAGQFTGYCTLKFGHKLKKEDVDFLKEHDKYCIG
jgi:hypothetical protein